MKWPLVAMFGQRMMGNTNLATVRSLYDAFKYWKNYFEKDAKECRERAAKLELIGDRDAFWERRKANSAEEDAARCDVGIKALAWAIEKLSQPAVKP